MTTIKDAVEDLLGDRGKSAEEVADRHFAPGFRQRVNGTWIDRGAFVAQMTALRGAVEHATVTVLDEVVDGDRYAERHVVDLLRTDGGRIRQEVFLFAERDAEGRFVRIEEVSVASPPEPPR
jgi:hypothetical protein